MQTENYTHKNIKTGIKSRMIPNNSIRKLLLRLLQDCGVLSFVFVPEENSNSYKLHINAMHKH